MIKEYYIILGGVFFLSLIMQYFLRKIAIKKSILDIPNSRSSHSVPTPRVGGLGIVLLWYTFLFLNFKSETFLDINSSIIFIIAFPITLISILDDFYSLKPSFRLIIQSGSVLFGVIILFITNSITINLIWVFIFTIVFFAGVWFINLYNFLDGIDGFAASQAILFFIISYYFTHSTYLLVASSIVIGFLFFNWHPAKIFMGDAGSTLLGFIIFFSALIFHMNGSQNILISLSYTAIFWSDASITLVRRFINKEKLTIAHKKHAYQRLTQSGLKHSQVTLIMISAYLIIFTLQTGLFCRIKGGEYLTLLFSIIVCIIYLIYAEHKKPFPTSK